MDHKPLKRPHFFYTTAPNGCPYLPGRLERKIVTELTGPRAEDFHEILSAGGFRRSHSIAYAPACPGCNACIPVRVVASEFVHGRTFRRIMKANAEIRTRIVPPLVTDEQYQLFQAYQKSRHATSDMALMGYFDYRSMVEDSPIETMVVEFRDTGDRLIACSLVDMLQDGISAVYSFFDTDEPKRSLGTYSVLWLIDYAREVGLPYVYLGYWIAESPKMSYKTRFKPLEAFGPGGWERLSDAAIAEKYRSADCDGGAEAPPA